MYPNLLTPQIIFVKVDKWSFFNRAFVKLNKNAVCNEEGNNIWANSVKQNVEARFSGF
jgi:hypothetical protein